MKHKEMQNEIWQNLQRLTRLSQLMQYMQRYMEDNKKGFQRFDPIFGLIFWQAQYCMIMQIHRMTEHQKNNVLSIGAWLEMGFKIDHIEDLYEPVDQNLLQEAYSDYLKILESEQYVTCKILRNKHYAHQDINKWNIKDFKSPTWTELYSLITQLQHVYQKAARANYCPGSAWKPIVTTVGYSGNFEMLIKQFLWSINAGARHFNDELIERRKKRNEKYRKSE